MKLERKSEVFVLVGYSDTGYLLYDPCSKTEVLASQVKCDESRNWSNLENEAVEVANSTFTINEPAEITYIEAINGPNKEQWKKAIEEEIAVHHKNKPWSIVERRKNVALIYLKWVLKVKSWFKARLVARGFLEKFDYSVSELYAPVVR